MPFNVSRSANFADIEVLKYGVSLDGVPVKSAVIDATDVATINWAETKRNIVPAGTILKLSTTNPNQVVKYNGTGSIYGILAHSTDFLANATAGQEAVPVFFHNCIFATKSIVDYTVYASALGSTLNTCKFE